MQPCPKVQNLERSTIWRYNGFYHTYKAIKSVTPSLIFVLHCFLYYNKNFIVKMIASALRLMIL